MNPGAIPKFIILNLVLHGRRASPGSRGVIAGVYHCYGSLYDHVPGVIFCHHQFIIIVNHCPEKKYDWPRLYSHCFQPLTNHFESSLTISERSAFVTQLPYHWIQVTFVLKPVSRKWLVWINKRGSSIWTTGIEVFSMNSVLLLSNTQH